MGDCLYCAKPAGIFRKRHKECESKYLAGKTLFLEQVVSAAQALLPLEALEAKCEEIRAEYYLRENDVRPLLVQGWESAVNRAFEDGVLSEEEEGNLVSVQKQWSLNQDELDINGVFTKVVKGGVLRDLMEGEIPDRISVEGGLPFNFQKSEKLIWVFQDTNYYEEKIRREFVGGSQGVSIRVAKGLYYRVGAFKGRSVTHDETVHAGTGMLAVTNKHLYFGGGSGKSFRIRLNKIVSFEAYSDGIGIMRDAATAKPQSFSTGDGWFTYNLIQNAANL